jgi:hypothetical protein
MIELVVFDMAGTTGMQTVTVYMHTELALDPITCLQWMTPSAGNLLSLWR